MGHEFYQLGRVLHGHHTIHVIFFKNAWYYSETYSNIESFHSMTIPFRTCINFNFDQWFQRKNLVSHLYIHQTFRVKLRKRDFPQKFSVYSQKLHVRVYLRKLRVTSRKFGVYLRNLWEYFVFFREIWIIDMKPKWFKYLMYIALPSIFFSEKVSHIYFEFLVIENRVKIINL